MRLSGSVRAGLGIALCVLLAATCAAQETNNGTKTNEASVSPKSGNDSGVNGTVTTAPTVKIVPTTIHVLPANTTTHVVVPTNATTTNKTVTVTATTPNITTVTKTTPAATTKATAKPTSANATISAATTSAATTGSTVSAAIKNKGFDLGSFIGGIVLTLCLLAVAYFGCRFYSSRRGVRYRTIDEHEAII